MIGVAHEDDDLLFINPQIQELITARCPLDVVYLTAGDAGKSFSRSPYPKSREHGMIAAYAAMAGSGQHTVTKTITVNNHHITSFSLRERPEIRLTFFRLPDGLPTGKGSSRYRHESLLRLFRGQISGITTVDSSTRYTERSLIATITALAKRWKTERIRTLDFDNASFGHTRTRGADHSDHGVTARYFRMAGFPLHLRGGIIAYRGYPMALLPDNLAPARVRAKQRIFETYLHTVSCVPPRCNASPSITPAYRNWMHRQYPRPRQRARPGAIVSQTGGADLCLEVANNLPGTAEGAVRTARCNGGAQQSWHKLRAGRWQSGKAHGGCLTAAPSPRVSPCDSKAPDQRWRMNPSGQLVSGDACLIQDDAARSAPRLHLGSCPPVGPENTWLWRP
ncbi:ricin-type beta-trefoil lectin domain protein [Streptomyces sp. WELS2]|uniref:ricin-type beta-trefoil lectin domain protein n=1 Tax=Streptomyces sp. WELS2 TaxID=2749435 RepID=UPI0015F0678F|nr:ricin-type beta-trefoil lectin domain protein [Streptomyces sp. WELS2]